MQREVRFSRRPLVNWQFAIPVQSAAGTRVVTARKKQTQGKIRRRVRASTRRTKYDSLHSMSKCNQGQKGWATQGRTTQFCILGIRHTFTVGQCGMALVQF